MRRTYINIALRRLVRTRAKGLCEYCLVHEDDEFAAFHVDHIISEKHRGPTEAENLAYACQTCNINKGSDIGGITERTGEICRFFNPRTDRWQAHFALNGVWIVSLTSIAEVTERILGFNDDARLSLRQQLQKLGRYPPPEALE